MTEEQPLSTQECQVQDAGVGDQLVGWTVEQFIDPRWYAVHTEVALDPCPDPTPPRSIDLEGVSQVIGRRSISRNITPDLDCSPDTGVSRRHAGLLAESGRLYLEDLGSANGTYLARAGDPIPEVPIPIGRQVEVGVGDSIYLGAWTRLDIRRSDHETVSLTDDRTAVTTVLPADS